ncbi:hypothetical protein LPL9_2217 [Lacticaseibacillus paracasei]|nr:hypothetical protein LPL9_2217 [Lacticaseibacillus paracasei]
MKYTMVAEILRIKYWKIVGSNDGILFVGTDFYVDKTNG